MKRELLPEQEAAAHEISKHVSVTAGPGSGKTTVLVERFLHVLRTQKLNIDQIVAITFTNRAANEMRERLRDELNTLLKEASPEERPYWLNYKRTLDGAIITTIHGFCVRLLREFPVEARVDPQFVLLDEHRTAMLLDAVVEDVLSEFISSGHLEVSRLTLGVGRAKLAAGLALLYREVRGKGLSLDTLGLTTAASHEQEERLSALLGELDGVVDRFLSIPRTTPAAKSKLEAFTSAWPNTRQLLNAIPTPERLAEYCQAVDDFRDVRPSAAAKLAEHVRAVDAFVWEKNLLGQVPQLCLDVFAKTYALEMVNMLDVIDNRFKEEKQKISALDFDDLESRTLNLLEDQSVLTRSTERYRFFLVDEFQDTNAVQKQLLERLVLSQKRRGANLFIVGDPKQSIYGFRGADVDVFRSMTETLVEAGGKAMPLAQNFRSQPPLINFFNYLFERLFQPSDDVPSRDRTALQKLGYVEHEFSEARRELRDEGPLVEVLVSTKPVDDNLERDLREFDAEQLALRINLLIQNTPDLKYSDIALLFRAMTQVQTYEIAFRRAGIPYQTVLGRGFYERDEISDLIQLLRFLDNRTDEIALAAVLRSPLCGISDNALLALRLGPKLHEITDDGTPELSKTRRLYSALREHNDVVYISEEEHELLERAAKLISRLVARRHHHSIEDLLRFAVDESEYFAVIAANFDGAQRLANVQRLFTLAARFEHSGNHLIRDFVRYVHEFEAIGSRESEGQIDEAANAVKLMTIHQAKGLEFPVVILPELQRPLRAPAESSFLLDRHQGLTLKVPDGRGRLVAGTTFTSFEKRQLWREQFETMRLLYVAATRARDRLILSGASEELSKLSGKPDSWLKATWQILELENVSHSGVVERGDVRFQVTLNLKEESQPLRRNEEVTDTDRLVESDSLETIFPLLPAVAPERTRGGHRFSVTQLINYQRCARQYYFDRVLELPSADELAVWNNADAPEPPANLNAALKGAVIHRFCERYLVDQDVEECLRTSFGEIVRLRQAELADRLVEMDTEAAIKELLPLAENYLRSDLFARVERARSFASPEPGQQPGTSAGLWSELSFRLRRQLGVLSGAIDKLLITPAENGELEIEIIDFKTNRLSTQISRLNQTSPAVSEGVATAGKGKKETGDAQFAFNFETEPPVSTVGVLLEETVPDAVRSTALDYQLQMQAYALAIRQLLPFLSNAKIRVTLHFLEPNVEFQLSDESLSAAACEEAIDNAIVEMISASGPEHFPVKPTLHCRTCNFLRLCAAGREWITRSTSNRASVDPIVR
jgi:ATP-dependent helicase/nuclease subunit A